MNVLNGYIDEPVVHDQCGGLTCDLCRESVISVLNVNIGKKEENEFVARFDNMERLHFDARFEGFEIFFEIFCSYHIVERVL